MKKKILMGLLSLIIAFGLWVYVITVVSPGSEETFYNIPVVMTGESYLSEHELIITSVSDMEVDLKLQGDRTDLNKLNSSNITVVADLTKIYNAGTHKLRYDVYYPGDIPSNAIAEQNRTPAEIRVTVENRKSSQIPVQIVYVGAVPEGYATDKENSVLDNPKIMVTGPESVINQIASAVIEVDLTDRTESVSENYPITLCNKNGEPVDVQMVTPSVTEVHLDLKIQRVKKIDLKLLITPGGGATEQNSNIEIEPASIQIAGSEAALEQLESLEIGEINLGDFTTDTSLTFPVDKLLPEGVTNLTGVAEAVVKISFPKLLIREFNVKRIEAINVPEDMHVQLVTEVLTVKIRGASALVSAMKEEELSVIVDFSSMAVGTASVKAEIVIPDKYEGVGEMGTYSVYAELREGPPPEEEQ